MLIESATRGSPEVLSRLRPVDAYVNKLLVRAELVAWYCQGEMQGLVAFYANDPRQQMAFVTMVAVVPEKRRSGVGKFLLTTALMSIAARGFRRCSLEVEAGNSGAISLYQAFGFERAGVSGDVITMELKFPASGSRHADPSEK